MAPGCGGGCSLACFSNVTKCEQPKAFQRLTTARHAIGPCTYCFLFFFFLFSFLLSPPHLPTQNPALKPLLFFYQDEKSVSLRTLDLLMSWQFQHDLSSPAQRQPRSSPAAGDCGMLPQWHLPGQINLEQNNAPYCSIACGCASHGHGLLCAAIDMPVFTT